MGMVRALKDVYLNEYGHHTKDSEFNYTGPDNENLVSVEAGPYADYSDSELREEIKRRNLTYVAVATSKELQAVLEGDDAKVKTAPVTPKATKPALGDAPDRKAGDKSSK